MLKYQVKADGFGYLLTGPVLFEVMLLQHNCSKPDKMLGSVHKCKLKTQRNMIDVILGNFSPPQLLSGNPDAVTTASQSTFDKFKNGELIEKKIKPAWEKAITRIETEYSTQCKTFCKEVEPV